MGFGFFGRKLILVVTVCMVWTGWSSIYPKHPFCQVAFILFILFFKSSWWKIASAAKNLSNYVQQTAERTTFAFSSVFILWVWTCWVEGVKPVEDHHVPLVLAVHTAAMKTNKAKYSRHFAIKKKNINFFLVFDWSISCPLLIGLPRSLSISFGETISERLETSVIPTQYTCMYRAIYSGKNYWENILVSLVFHFHNKWLITFSLTLRYKV